MDAFLKYITDNLALMKPAKGPICALMVVMIVACTTFWNWYFGEVKSENSRLKSVIGIGSPAVNPYIELTDGELRTKALRVVKALRGIYSHHQNQMSELDNKKKKREVTEIGFNDLLNKERQRAIEELRNTVQVEALMVFDQLKTRVPATAHMQLGIGGLELNPADKRDAPISLHRMFSMTDMSIVMTPLLANNIEELRGGSGWLDSFYQFISGAW
ncbi:MAG: hypothetical protein AABY61_05670, partial [Nitrospirota bacterium]